MKNLRIALRASSGAGSAGGLTKCLAILHLRAAQFGRSPSCPIANTTKSVSGSAESTSTQWTAISFTMVRRPAPCSQRSTSVAGGLGTCDTSLCFSGWSKSPTFVLLALTPHARRGTTRSVQARAFFRCILVQLEQLFVIFLVLDSRDPQGKHRCETRIEARLAAGVRH